MHDPSPPPSTPTAVPRQRANAVETAKPPCEAIETPKPTKNNPNTANSTAQPPSTPRTLLKPQSQRQSTRTPPNPQPNHLRHPECHPSLSLTHATSVPECCPPSTNKRPCHVSTGAPSTTAEAREEMSGEAREEAGRPGGGGGFGPSRSSLYPPLQPTA